jgi:hypothetical protein
MLNGERERIERIENSNGTTTVRTISEVFSQGLLVMKNAEERIIPGGLGCTTMGRMTTPPLITDKPTTSLTQPAEQKSEQLISQTTTTSTSIDTKPLDGKASTENSSTGVKGWIKSIFTIMILIAILVMAYLAWKKWGKDLMQKIKNKHTSPQIKE